MQLGIICLIDRVRGGCSLLQEMEWEAGQKRTHGLQGMGKKNQTKRGNEQSQLINAINARITDKR